jgi:predicted nucleic acid-binding protein
MTITIDASAVAAWLLPDEASVAADDLYARALHGNESFQAPALFAWETGNLLNMARWRGRITAAQANSALRLLGRARVKLEPGPELERMEATIEIARRNELSVYDASYLEQALRTGAQLATKDMQLRRCALKAGVVCLDL